MALLLSRRSAIRTATRHGDRAGAGAGILIQPRRRGTAGRELLALLLLGAGGTFNGSPAAAQQAGYGQTLGGPSTPQERRMFGNGSSGPGGGSGAPIDARNPLDLINQLRRSSAMDDATPPASAVDRALRDLEATKGAPASPPGTTPGASLKAP